MITILDFWFAIYGDAAGFGLMFVFVAIWLISRSRLGVLWPNGTLVFGLNANGSYDKIWMKSKGTFVVDQKRTKIFASGPKTTYLPNGAGPNVGVADVYQDKTVNARLAHYAVKMKTGDNDLGIMFDTLPEACFYAFENIILKGDKYTNYRDQYLEKLRRAKASSIYIDVVGSEESSSVNPQTGQPNITSTSTTQEVQGLSDLEYETFYNEVRDSIAQSKIPIMQVRIDGQLLSLNDYVGWANTPAPSVVQDHVSAWTEKIVRDNIRKAPDAVLKYAVAIAAIIVAGAISAAILLTVK